MKVDFHDYKGRLERAMRKVRSDRQISARNRGIIEDFITHCNLESLHPGRQSRYAWALCKIARWLGKDFDKATKSDIEKVVGKIESPEFTVWTKQLYKVTIKKFYKWLNNGEYPDTVKWIRCTIKNASKRLPEEILTEEEVKKMIETAEHPRDKAIIAALYESGCRISELAGLLMKHLVFDEYGTQIIVDGKTGMRRIRLIASTPYLSVWKNNHPFKDRPDGALWISVGTRDHGEMMKYETFRSLLKNIAKRAGVTKRINPHSFRHARATHLSKHLKEFQMNQYFGWVQGSDMPRTYVHLSGRDMDDALLEIYGIKKRQQEKESPLKPKVCQICQNVNEATSDFCDKCARPLDIKTMIELEAKRKAIDQAMESLFKVPEVVETLVGAMAKDTDARDKILGAYPEFVERVTLHLKNIIRNT